ncbi:MAG: signal recognition particle-docking protein FtsY [Spirochaetales bacterium]|nr:signal recognition particle-docking protein FtsY [Spirochaetales bacterium]
MIKKIAQGLKRVIKAGHTDEEFLEYLEELLIEGDFGVSVAGDVVSEFTNSVKNMRKLNRKELVGKLKNILKKDLLATSIEPEKNKLNLFLVFGVNGVGKTTTIAKMAHYYMQNYGLNEVVLSAADTYRAGAIDQLILWGERLKIPVVHQSSGADPGAVIYDSIASAKARKAELLIVDTAGRMHSRVNLVKELKKINKVVISNLLDGAYKKILVIDATTGQNALQQTEIFNEAIGIDAVVLAKYDSTAKGGVAAAVSKKLKIPFVFLGTGEKLEDLIPFDINVYLDNLLDIK